MHDLVELPREKLIDVGDTRRDRRLDVLGDAEGAAHRLFDEGRDLAAGLLALLLVAPDPGLGNDLVEQTDGRVLDVRLLAWRPFRFVSHRLSPLPPR